MLVRQGSRQPLDSERCYTVVVSYLWNYEFVQRRYDLPLNLFRLFLHGEERIKEIQGVVGKKIDI